MERISVKTSVPYEVIVDCGILDRIGEFIKELIPTGYAMLVTDANVEKLYAERVKKSLNSAGFTVFTHVIPVGESSKCFSEAENLLIDLAEKGFSRSDFIVALGGGVVGDLSGFVASCYMRGIKVVQIPTTLLAEIDSSVGGKTAIDLPQGKNLVGSFYQPTLVVADTSVLCTLSESVFKEGMGEMAKYAILDKKMFDLMSHSGIRVLDELVIRAITLKRDIVEKDEKDVGTRILLNLGHTVGHSIELLSGYTCPHGKAVAMGLYAVARGSLKKGYIDKKIYDNIASMLENNDLYNNIAYSAFDLSKAALHDKKADKNSVTVLTIHGIGKIEKEQMSFNELEEFLS